MGSPPEPPTPAAWASLLGQVPNRKFEATTRAYEMAGFAPAGDLPRLVAANVEFAYRYYTRLARLRYAGPRRRLLASIDPAGTTPLREAVAQNAGVLLVSAHLGDFDIAGAWIAQEMGVEIVVVADPVAEPARQRWFDSIRRASGIIIRTRGATRLEDVETDLRRRRVVLFMLDRRSPGPGIAGELMGRPALLPLAPYVLARRTGAQVVFGSTTTHAGGHQDLLTERLCVLDEGEITATAFLAPLAHAMTRHVCRCPWQWHVPADFDQLAYVTEQYNGAVGGDVVDRSSGGTRDTELDAERLRA